MQYRIDGKLVGERTRRPSSFMVSECLFAVLICSSRKDMAMAATTFDEVSAGWGLSLNMPKTISCLLLELDCLLLL